MNNYFPTENPFQLVAPPQWWLAKMWDMDSQLVVFPSRCRPVHVLARRRSKSLAMEAHTKIDKDLLRKSAGQDGDILADNNLIFVRHLIGNTVRRFNFFQWLKDADTWNKDDGKDFATRVDEIDQARDTKIRLATLDDIDQRAKDAYRSYQARTGRRSKLTYNTSRQAKQVG